MTTQEQIERLKQKPQEDWTIGEIRTMYNQYQIDRATKNKLLKGLKEKSKKAKQKDVYCAFCMDGQAYNVDACLECGRRYPKNQ